MLLPEDYGDWASPSSRTLRFGGIEGPMLGNSAWSVQGTRLAGSQRPLAAAGLGSQGWHCSTDPFSSICS